MKKILIFGIIMTLLGCTQTTPNYYYISLENIEKIISFDVVDSSGVVIAKEHILFTVKHNGTYTLLDAI